MFSGWDWLLIVVGSFVLANTIAWLLRWYRGRRIESKVIALDTEARTWTGPPVPVTVVTGFLGAGVL